MCGRQATAAVRTWRVSGNAAGFLAAAEGPLLAAGGHMSADVFAADGDSRATGSSDPRSPQEQPAIATVLEPRPHHERPVPDEDEFLDERPLLFEIDV